jgi:alpha/beta superfamily hydrolase
MIDFSDIRNSHGERLDCRHELAASGTRRQEWVVILAHGVTGNLDRPVIVDTARALREAGFDTLRFSFAGNGASDGDFREATPSREIGDLAAVIDNARRHYPKIAVVGHSMGAAVAVMSAAMDTRICALVSLAGMVDTRRFAETEFGDVDPGQGTMWDDPGCPLSQAFMDDLCITLQSVLPQAARINIPWLLVHGSADDVVLQDDTQSVVALGVDHVESVIIEGGDHSFSDPGHKLAMTTRVAAWLADQA